MILKLAKGKEFICDDGVKKYFEKGDVFIFLGVSKITNGCLFYSNNSIIRFPLKNALTPFQFIKK